MFISVNRPHKQAAVEVAKRFHELGFKIAATRGTAAGISAAGIPVKTVFKVNEGRPNAVGSAEGRFAATGDLHRHNRSAFF